MFFHKANFDNVERDLTMCSPLYSGTRGRMLDMHWLLDTRCPVLLFVTSQGVELYALIRRRLKHLKTHAYPIVCPICAYKCTFSDPTGDSVYKSFLSHSVGVPLVSNRIWISIDG